jgi:hypothetical protein
VAIQKKSMLYIAVIEKNSITSRYGDQIFSIAKPCGDQKNSVTQA